MNARRERPSPVLAALIVAALGLGVPACAPAASAVSTHGMGLSDLAAADRNEDGQISRSEWGQHHREWFHLMDRNRDGFISRNERQMHRLPTPEGEAQAGG